MDVSVRSYRTEPSKIKPYIFPKVFEGSKETFFKKFPWWGQGATPLDSRRTTLMGQGPHVDFAVRSEEQNR
jgi:hypothetical protein